MSKKNVVSIEDRIPKLKQARKKKANRRLIFYLSIFFFLISIIVYLQSPLSHVKTISITGNSFMKDEEVIEQSELSHGTNIWTINKEKIKQALNSNPMIESVEVRRVLPWTVEINLTEHGVVGYIKKESAFYPIIGNGTILTKHQQKANRGDAPLIIGFTEEKYLHRMAEELMQLPKSILNLISEVHWKPTDDNKNKLLLYMNDGYIVSGTIRNFAEKMAVYPSIASQLEPGSKGIIHIGVGAYFEDFNSRDEEQINDDEEE